MQKNDVFEGAVTAFGSDGEGIIKTGGTTAFVPLCMLGEKVRAKALKVKGNIVYGKVESILEPSKERVTPPCPVFGKCGGCDLQHMSYPAQLEFKRGQVEGALSKIGGIYAAVNAVVPCDKQFRYRNKLALPVGVDSNGETVLGFYAQRSHRIVPAADCLIQSEWYKDIVAAVKRYADMCRLNGYDEQTRTGELRQIVVREIKGKFIVAVVATRRINLEPFAVELEKIFKNFTLLLNVNNTTSNVIFSKEWHICRGEGTFEAEERGIKYVAGANTFIQVNDGVREKLYSRVIEEVGEADVAIDLYSGGGLLTAMLAKACGRAYGVEVVEEASRCADALAQSNGLKEIMTNICGKVEDEIDKVMSATSGKRRVIVCDPPRKGMERSVVKKIAQSGAEKIVLISCNPATLARDLGLLTGTLRESPDGALIKTPASGAPSATVGNSAAQTVQPSQFSTSNGSYGVTAPNAPANSNAQSPSNASRAKYDCTPRYKITCIQPFDMFANSKHVETLVTLCKE